MTPFVDVYSRRGRTYLPFIQCRTLPTPPAHYKLFSFSHSSLFRRTCVGGRTSFFSAHHNAALHNRASVTVWVGDGFGANGTIARCALRLDIRGTQCQRLNAGGVPVLDRVTWTRLPMFYAYLRRLIA